METANVKIPFGLAVVLSEVVDLLLHAVDANGNVVSRTLISKDNYKQTSKIVVVGTKKVEVAPPVVETPVEPIAPETPVTPVTPVTPPEEPDSDLPTGWDTPENPYYN